MRKILLAIILVPIIFTFVKGSVFAFVLEKTYDRTFEAKDDYVQITETKSYKIIQPNWYVSAGTDEEFIIFNPVKNDTNQKEKLQMTKDSIRVVDGNGSNLNFISEDTTNSNILIHVKFPTNLYYNSNFKIVLSYKSYGLLIKNGALRDLYIPAFSKDYQFITENSSEKVNTTIKIPVGYGDINFIAPKVDSAKEGDFWVVNFPQDKLIGETGWIQIGTAQNFNFKIVQPYSSTTSLPISFNTYKLTIPRDITSGPIKQKVYYTSIDPAPYSIEEDSDGNLIATFKTAATAQGEIVITGYAVLTQDNSFDFKDSGDVSSIPKDVLEKNTKSAKYWESDDPEIKKVATELKGSETNVYKIIQKTYQYVINKIDYSEVKRFGINKRQGALATLKGGAAVCMEYSDLFIALIRAQGIPARGAFGYGYSALDSFSTEDNTINHQWAEVYIPSVKSWIEVDTTWGENGQEIIGGDLNHFYSHVASVSPEIPSTTEVTYFGAAEQIADRQMSVNPAEKITKSSQILSEDDLIKLYPSKDDFNKIKDSLLGGINQIFSALNSQLNQILEPIPGITPSSRSIIKAGIGLVFILIGVGIFIFIRKKKIRFKV